MSTATISPSQDKTNAIERLLKPRSVAIVGASASPGALGASTIANLDRMNYSGDVYLINPKRDEIGGRRCLNSINDLPLGVDAAVLAIPRAAVLDTVRALARRQVGAAVIFSAGFAEGGEEGIAEQRELARIAAESGMIIEGPNCLGLVNYVDNVALTFVETPSIPLGDRPGIGIVSQSGAMAAVLGVMLTSRELGLSYSVSTGNEAASGVEDYVEHLLDDDQTTVIGMIVEQFRQPKRFIELAERARERGKHIALLHPGRSNAARESAATHTGAMAGDYQVMRVLVERAGVIVADSLEQLSDILELSSRCPALPSRGSAVITESGAFKALTLDLCELIGLPLPALTNDSSPQLRSAMPSFVPVSNPLDLTAQALVDPDLYRRTLAALLDDQRFGSIVFGIIQTDEKTSDLKFPPIIDAIKSLNPQVPVIFAGLDEGAAVPEKYIHQLHELNIPCFMSPDRALRAVAAISKHTAQDVAKCEPISLHLKEKLPASGAIAEYRAKQLLTPLGIPFPSGQLTTNLDEALKIAVQVGFPVVLKAQSSDLSHKSDAGGVILDIQNEEELEQGWLRMHNNLAQHCPDINLDGILIEKMGARGIEFIVGGRNDPEWGPVILAGFGGVQAELMKDVRLLPPDLSIDGIVQQLHKLKQKELLKGFRGSPALDVRALAQTISCVASLLKMQPQIQEIDLNPVIVHPEGRGVVALDALMYVNH